MPARGWCNPLPPLHTGQVEVPQGLVAGTVVQREPATLLRKGFPGPGLLIWVWFGFALLSAWYFRGAYRPEYTLASPQQLLGSPASRGAMGETQQTAPCPPAPAYSISARFIILP